MKRLEKPTWVFLESSGYSLLDVYGEIITFCRNDNRLTVYVGKYSLLPEAAVLQRYQHPIISVGLIHSNAWIRVVVAHANGIEIIQLDDVIDSSVVNKRIILSNVFLLDDQLTYLFGVDPTTSFLVVALNDRLKMKLLNKDSEFSNLGAHTSRIHILDFLISEAILLMTCSKDTCKVWNLELKQLVHTVNYPGISPRGFSFQSDEKSFLLGTQDGKIISVDLSKSSFESYELCKLHESTAKSTTMNAIENKPKNNGIQGVGRSRWSNEVQINPIVSTELACCILAFTHVLVGNQFSGTILPSLYARSIAKLVIVTSSRICIFDVTTHRLDADWKWPELGLKGWCYVLSAALTVTPHAVNFWIQGTQNEIAFFTIPLSNLILPRMVPNEGDTEKANLEGPILSLLACDELHPDSVLRKNSICSNPPVPTKGATHGRQKTSLNKPVTFGHAIKSSGYAKQEPKRKMFQPITSASAHVRKTKETPNTNLLEHAYEKSDAAPSVLCRLGSADTTITPVYQLAYSPSGGHLAAALGNSACLVLRCPLNKQPEPLVRPTFDFPKGEVLCGHKGPILSVAWSTDSRLLLTSSADRTARIWSMKDNSNEQSPKAPPRTVLVLDSKSGGATTGYGERTAVRAGSLKKSLTMPQIEPFPDNIQFAQFHYMDAFVYLVCRNVIHLFSYKITSPQSVLDKGKASGTYKLIGEFPMNTCNQLTAVSSVNIFYSYLLICAGSDRGLSVLDLNSNQVVLQIENAHTRNITGIALNQGSMYSSLTQNQDEPLAHEQTYANSYNTYATVAPGDGVRMWDLRNKEHAVMQFMRPDAPFGHKTAGFSQNPLVPPVTAAFSPCGRQLIVGGGVTPSQPYPVIYDTRRAGSHPLAILRPKLEKGRSAPTTVVAWHPIRPEVTTGSHNGLIATYTAPEQ